MTDTERIEKLEQNQIRIVALLLKLETEIKTPTVYKDSATFDRLAKEWLARFQ